PMAIRITTRLGKLTCSIPVSLILLSQGFLAAQTVLSDQEKQALIEQVGELKKKLGEIEAKLAAVVPGSTAPATSLASATAEVDKTQPITTVDSNGYDWINGQRRRFGFGAFRVPGDSSRQLLRPLPALYSPAPTSVPNEQNIAPPAPQQPAPPPSLPV